MIHIAPSTRIGQLSSFGLLLSVAGYAVFFLMVWSGQRGGDAFYSNLLLAIPITFAVVGGIAAAVGAFWEAVAKRTTSVVGLISMAYGTLIAVFVLGELVQPH